jgi:hypothetical protein
MMHLGIRCVVHVREGRATSYHILGQPLYQINL